MHFTGILKHADINRLQYLANACVNLYMLARNEAHEPHDVTAHAQHDRSSGSGGALGVSNEWVGLSISQANRCASTDGATDTHCERSLSPSVKGGAVDHTPTDNHVTRSTTAGTCSTVPLPPLLHLTILWHPVTPTVWWRGAKISWLLWRNLGQGERTCWKVTCAESCFVSIHCKQPINNIRETSESLLYPVNLLAYLSLVIFRKLYKHNVDISVAPRYSTLLS